ncbi:hypothetical protein EOA36_18595, partial [Mesorhizobium sp. M8A.F.Ca.ET.021.01.1.1]
MKLAMARWFSMLRLAAPYRLYGPKREHPPGFPGGCPRRKRNDLTSPGWSGLRPAQADATKWKLIYEANKDQRPHRLVPGATLT